MSLPTFRPNPGPSPGTSHKPTVNLLKAEFGDGYTQHTPNGINHIKRSLSLRWDGLLYEEMEEIIDFFYKMQGNKPFYYKPYGERDTIKWTCSEWAHTAEGGVLKITATLVESFTHET